MTRLYQHLLVRLMPYDLLDAMHIVYEECAESCRGRTTRPFIHPVERFGDWLRLAQQTGWNPPERPLYIGDTSYVRGFDDGSQPSWLEDESWPTSEMQ